MSNEDIMHVAKSFSELLVRICDERDHWKRKYEEANADADYFESFHAERARANQEAERADQLHLLCAAQREEIDAKDELIATLRRNNFDGVTHGHDN